MATVQIQLEIPESILTEINNDKKSFSREAKKIIAVEMYRTGRLSLGKSALLADICKKDFISLLSEKGVSLFNWDVDDINKEIENVDKLIKEIK